MEANIPLGLRVPNQSPLDAKTVVSSEAVLYDLGEDSYLAYIYYKGLVIYCSQEGTRWEWREVAEVEIDTPLFEVPYTYPDGILINDVDYSNKSYNFFPFVMGGGSRLNALEERVETLETEFEDLTIPTKVSELENDSNFDTVGSVNSKDTIVLNAAKDYADDLASGLLDDRGNYDASSNLFPSIGGSGVAGAIKKGDLWYISVPGTLGTEDVEIGFNVRSLVDNPGQTASNWNILGSSIGYIPEDSENKQNSLISDGIGKVFPTVDAVVEGLDSVATEAKDYTDALGVQLINGAPITGDTLKKIHDRLVAQEAIVGGTTPDGDNIVNTVAELMAVLTSYPEGTNMFTLITDRILKTDIYNALDYAVAGKVLDARQGKVLNDALTALTTVVGTKAADSNVLHKTGYSTETKQGELVIDSGTNNTSGLKLNRLPQTTSITSIPVSSSVSKPRSMCKGPDGNFYVVSEDTKRVYKVLPNGTTTIFATSTNNIFGICYANDGYFYITVGGYKVERISTSGVLTSFVSGLPNIPDEIVQGSDGNLYITAINVIAKVALPSGTVTTFASGFNYLSGITNSPDGSLYVANMNAGYKIKKVTVPGAIVTDFSTTTTQLTTITLGVDGCIYGTDIQGLNDKVTKIGLDGVVSVYYASSNEYLSGIAQGNDGLFYTCGKDSGLVSKITNGFIKPLVTDEFGNVKPATNLEDKAYAELQGGKIPAYQLQPSNISYNSTTGVITFTDATGVVQTIDLPVENLFQNAGYNSTTQKLTLTTNGGGTVEVDLATLMDLPEIVLSPGSNPSVAPTTGQKLYFRTDNGNYWIASSGSWLGAFVSVTQAVLNGKEAVVNKVQSFVTHETDPNAYPSVPAVIAADTVLQGQIDVIISKVAIAPTYTQPSSSLSIANALYEIGQTVSISTSQTFVQGDAGAKASEAIKKNTVTVSTGSTFSESLVIPQGITTYGGTVTYLEGVVKNNNFGLPSPTNHIAAGTVTSPNKTVEGVYPLFATTSTIATLTKQANVSMVSGNNVILVLVTESGGNKQKFDIPTAWITARPLLGVQMLNTVSGAYEYPGGSAATSLAVWSITDVTQTIQANTINYKRYTYNGSDRASVSIKLIF